MQAATLFAQTENTPALADIWALFGPYWWHTLSSLNAEDTIGFDTETTGVNPDMDEAVSIAARSYALPSGAPVKYHSLIAPRFPGKLLERNAKGGALTTSAVSTRTIWRVSRPFRPGTKRWRLCERQAKGVFLCHPLMTLRGHRLKKRGWQWCRWDPCQHRTHTAQNHFSKQKRH